MGLDECHGPLDLRMRCGGGLGLAQRGPQLDALRSDSLRGLAQATPGLRPGRRSRVSRIQAEDPLSARTSNGNSKMADARRMMISCFLNCIDHRHKRVDKSVESLFHTSSTGVPREEQPASDSRRDAFKSARRSVRFKVCTVPRRLFTSFSRVVSSTFQIDVGQQSAKVLPQ